MIERSESAFDAHVELLQTFLDRRAGIVAEIQQLIAAQQKAPSPRLSLSRQFDDFFFTGVSVEQLKLRGQLQAAHRAAGFTPRAMPDVHNDIVDPAEMLVRAMNLWRVSAWVGRHDRARFAQTLFNLYLLRCLELISMRVCDAGAEGASERLAQVQGLLDGVWRSSPADQPTLVRDARWLIPIAQSPTTEELFPYFEAAERVAQSLPLEHRREIAKASVVLAGGHLRSQLRHYDMQGTPLDEHGVVLKSRRSNALDFAMTMQGLVTLLQAYEQAIDGGDGNTRRELASIICQGISADPELFVNRIDLLGPYSMIEHLFVATDADGGVAYTHAGQRHVDSLRDYAALMGRLAPSLHEDCEHFRPRPGTYSPFGVLYGFSSNITEHMAMKALLRDAPPPFSLEDAFTDGDALKLAWVSGWRKLPHVAVEVQALFEYPQQFAQKIFARIELALQKQLLPEAAATAGRLTILAEEDAEGVAAMAQIQDLPLQYIVSCDETIVAAHEAVQCDLVTLLRDRQEGELALSFETEGGWAAITKDFITEILGEGRDVKIAGLPRELADALRLMCVDVVIKKEMT